MQLDVGVAKNLTEVEAQENGTGSGVKYSSVMSFTKLKRICQEGGQRYMGICNIRLASVNCVIYSLFCSAIQVCSLSTACMSLTPPGGVKVRVNPVEGKHDILPPGGIPDIPLHKPRNDIL